MTPAEQLDRLDFAKGKKTTIGAVAMVGCAIGEWGASALGRPFVASVFSGVNWLAATLSGYGIGMKFRRHRRRGVVMSLFSSKLKPSAPTMALIALKYARRPKTIAKFANYINARVDVPGLSEEQEQVALVKGITAALDAAAAAIEGKPVMGVESLRDTTREAVNFLAENIEGLNEAVDVPFVPESIERWAAAQLKDFLLTNVLDWIDGTQRLQ